MAKQLNLLGNGQIIPTALHVEMERSYLEYAMSVIVGRALPDVRDGLKPVHRRILYAMYELGLTPDRPYRKCARVVGDVLGKYHPHGDQSVYDALVRLVQTFATRYPLLDGHGNFGSIDNDPPAAMRYTETRLAPIAHEGMLREIGEATVDFTNNFDNSQQEPVVLPVQLPILLLNGCSGIAVGMATNIPPHNLGEVVDGLIALIDKPQLSDEKLYQIIPGPDFPTGGEIVEIAGIKDAYTTGRGTIKVRGVAKVETITLSKKKRRKERTAIIITELPYQVNKAGWIEKVADLVNQGKLEGIADIRDESDRTGMRVVIEIKKDANTQEVLHKLYRQTALQSNFGAIMLALVDNSPIQLSLRQFLEHFLEFREQSLRRQYGYELETAQNRLHLVSGLLIALDNIDRVIDILRNAPDGTTAKYRMEEELSITQAQGDSILAMPMRRLTGLEKQKLITEQEELQQRIQYLENLLSDRHELMKALKKELRGLKRKYGDKRRTKISNIVVNKDKVSSSTRPKRLASAQKEQNTVKAEKIGTNHRKSAKLDQLQPSVFEQEKLPQATIAITENHDIYWQNPHSDSEVIGSDDLENCVIERKVIGDRKKIIFVTDAGKAYPVALEDIPHYLESQNTNTLSLLSEAATRDVKQTVSHFFLPQTDQALDLVLLTEKGIIKRLPLSELAAIGNRGFVLIKLKEQDRLKYVRITSENEEVAIATSGGRILRLPVNDAQIPIMGRNAQGNQCLKLRYSEKLVGCVSGTSQDNLLLVSESGYGKRLPLNTLRLSRRGDIGTQAIQFSNKQDNLAAMVKSQPQADILLTTSLTNKFVVSVNDFPLESKDTQGNKLGKLKSQETIMSLNFKS
ncbi:MAG: DNA topoisomerase 4 subunit A [Xenococcaceae cyanobacterium MO_167.B52]|nr:DNA topoisomerase 4 subunit A [Xenococcaceae cyanobacterium MO_167.B52]